jgi:hypothetical protein
MSARRFEFVTTTIALPSFSPRVCVYMHVNTQHASAYVSIRMEI